MVDLAVEPELGQGSRAVAAADHGEAGARCHRFRHRARARREALVLEDAHRPVPEDGARLDDGVGELRGGPGSDVEAPPTSGNVAAHGADLVAVGVSGDDVGRHEDGRGTGEELPTGVELVDLEQRVAHRVALGGEKGEAHAPAHEKRVDPREQGADHAELVVHLGSAQHRDEGATRRVKQGAQHLDLAREQPPRRAREPGGGADDRRMGPVGRTEGVVDVEVTARDQALDERGVVALLARVEAQVLEQLDLGRQLGQPRPHRLHRIPRVGLALGPAQVTARGDRGDVVLPQPLDGGQRGADAQIVVDAAGGDRHVEVGA